MGVRVELGIVNTWSAVGTTIPGGVSFVAICVTGSAAAGAVNILDGTKLCYTVAVAITGSASFCPGFGVPFTSALITTVISTAGYSITYMPKV